MRTHRTHSPFVGTNEIAPEIDRTPPRFNVSTLRGPQQSFLIIGKSCPYEGSIVSSYLIWKVGFLYITLVQSYIIFNEN